jgi:16S rRNA (guanine527-N7)-methyltransferase
MNFENAKELLKKNNIELSKIQYDKFSKYEELLLEWNSKINLTAITDDKDIWIKHFLDSSTVLSLIKDKASIIDIGTGAGFPGVPLKIMNDSLSVTLLDSLNKRLMFLEEVCNKIELSNVALVHGRAEDIANNKSYREKYDVAISRAVANLSTLAEYCIPFVKVGGYFISMKGGNCKEEIEQANGAISILGAKIEKIINLTISDENLERTIIIVKKVEKTSKIYPRKAGTPSKKPLK